MQRPTSKESMEDLMKMQEDLLKRRAAPGRLSLTSATKSSFNASAVKFAEMNSRLMKSSVLSPVVEHNFDMVNKQVDDGKFQRNERLTQKYSTANFSAAASVTPITNRKPVAGGQFPSIDVSKTSGRMSPKFMEMDKKIMCDDVLAKARRLTRRISMSQPLISACKPVVPQIRAFDAESPKTTVGSHATSLYKKDSRVSATHILEMDKHKSNDDLIAKAEVLSQRISKAQSFLPKCEQALPRANPNIADSPSPSDISSRMAQALRRASVIPQRQVKVCPEDADRKVCRTPAGNASQYNNQFRPNITEQAGRANEVVRIKQEVHEENLTRLSAMSEEEILALQKRCQEALSHSKVDISALQERASVRASEKRMPENGVQAAPSGQVNVMEMDKLEWTTDVVPKKEAQATSASARFDLQGNLVPPDCQVSTKYALHHHGDEPDRAGYTLEELVYLTRSNALNQRVMAVKLLANIASNALKGQFDGVLESPIIPLLMEMNCLITVRLCLNDNAPTSLAACLRFIETLLWKSVEEEMLDQTLECCGGMVQPFLQTSDQKQKDVPPEEMVKIDFVQTLVDMLLIERIDYVFKCNFVAVSTPAPAIGQVECSLGTVVCNVLCRMARHSLAVCERIAGCKSVLGALVATCKKEAAALAEEDANASLDLFPQAKVLRLFRLLCASHVSVAKRLLHEWPVTSLILSFVQSNPADLPHIPPIISCQAIVECFRLWRCLVLYNLMVAEVDQVDYLLYDYTKQAQMLLNNGHNLSQPHFTFVRLRVIVALVESYVICRGNSVDFDGLKGYFELFEILFYNLVTAYVEARLNNAVNNSYSLLMSAMLNFLATSVHVGLRWAVISEPSCLKTALDHFSSCLESFKGSVMQQSVMQRAALSEPTAGAVEPSLGVSCMFDSSGQLSPFPLLASWYRLLYFDSLADKALSAEDDGSLLKAYLYKLNDHQTIKCTEYFARFELYTVYYAMGCNFEWFSSFDAFNLLQCFKKSQEWLYSRLMQYAFKQLCPFNAGQLVEPLLDVNAKMDFGKNALAPCDILTTVQSHMEEIGYCFGEELRGRFDKGTMERSSTLHHFGGFFGPHGELESQCCHGWWTPLEPSKFWYLEPIRRMHENWVKMAVVQNDSEELRVIICCLLMAYRLELLYIVDSSALYCYLTLLFHTDYYREPMVNQLLSIIYDQFLSVCKIDLRLPWPGETFEEIYTALLSAYENCSYGDASFGKFAALPLRNDEASRVLKVCLEENASVVKMLRQTIDQEKSL